MKGTHDRKQHRILLVVDFNDRVSVSRAVEAAQTVLNRTHWPVPGGVRKTAAKQGDKALAAHLRSHGSLARLRPVHDLASRAMGGGIDPFEALRQIIKMTEERTDV